MIMIFLDTVRLRVINGIQCQMGLHQLCLFSCTAFSDLYLMFNFVFLLISFSVLFLTLYEMLKHGLDHTNKYCFDCYIFEGIKDLFPSLACYTDTGWNPQACVGSRPTQSHWVQWPWPVFKVTLEQNPFWMWIDWAFCACVVMHVCLALVYEAETSDRKNAFLCLFEVDWE